MDLDLNVPEEPPKRERRILPILTFVAVLAAIGLEIGLSRPAPATGPEAADPRATRDLAETLERRTLYGEAADAWEEIARHEDDTATSLYRAGRSRMLAGEPAAALRDLYAAEEEGLSDDLRSESSRHVLECLAMLGKFAARDAELANRTSGGEEEGPAIVARVGEEPVTRAELTDAVRDEEARKLAARGALDMEALDEAVAARLADPGSLVPTLKGVVTRRALALQATEEGLASGAEFRRRLAIARRALLSDLLTRKRYFTEIDVPDRELRDHFGAHRDRYVRPAAVRFSYGPAGADPADFTKTDAWHAAGDAFPEGLGPSAEADALLFAMEPGEVSDRAVTVGGKQLRFRLDEAREETALSFEEAKERVREDLVRTKRMEAVRRLQDEVAAKHPVEILDKEIASRFER